MARVSVCMATYNGSAFIVEQVSSILQQLGIDDELIIVDDCSTDCTMDIIKEKFKDTRIRLYTNSVNSGVIRTFEKALYAATGEFIFLSDQDDIWTQGRMSLMLGCLSGNRYLLVSSNQQIVLEINDTSHNANLILKNSTSDKHFLNIVLILLGRIGYYGCLMGMNRKLLRWVLPIPSFIESHDLWIAMAANMLKSNLHIDEVTLLRRVHGDNVSVVKNSLWKKIISRVKMLRAIMVLSFRLAKGCDVVSPQYYNKNNPLSK